VRKIKKLATCIGGLAAGVFAAGAVHAGPGSVEVQTVGDIKVKMGAQIRIVPTGEIDRDFGLSEGLGPQTRLTPQRPWPPWASEPQAPACT